MTKISKKFKKGGISIFIVTITCVLISIVTASFVRVMLRDQQQASKNDLAQSAYDSAQAGIEDAKQFLKIYNSECSGGDSLNSKRCVDMAKALKTNSCYVLNSAGIGSSAGETQIQTSSSTNDRDLNQAYTCVKIYKDTEDYIGNVNEGAARTIPLRGINDFDTVIVSWHSEKNLSDLNDKNISLPDSNLDLNKGLPNSSEWSNYKNAPAALKAQFFGYTQGISSLTELDKSFSGNRGNGLDEIILFPAKYGSILKLPNNRRTGGNKTTEAKKVKCLQSLNLGGYSCQISIDLGYMVNTTKHDLAFVRLSAIYKDADFKLELFNSTTNSVVNFDNVQPKVDSTGRANQQFKRVESRLELNDLNFPVPDFAVQVEGDGNKPLCKDFYVTRKTQNNKCKEQ